MRYDLARTTWPPASGKNIYSVGHVTGDDAGSPQPQRTNLRSSSGPSYSAISPIVFGNNQQTPVGVAEQHGEGGADDGTESDGANGLVRQLEASDEEDDETKQTHKSPDEDDDDESVTGLWSALQYATYMTGMHFMVREKHRVQSILAAELEKADADFEDAPEEPSVTIDVRIQPATTEILKFCSPKSMVHVLHFVHFVPPPGSVSSHASTYLCTTTLSLTQHP